MLAAARAVDAGAGFLCRASDADNLRRRFDGVPLVIQTGRGLTGALASGLRTGALVVAGDVARDPAGVAAAAAAPAPASSWRRSHDGGFSLIGMRPFVPGVLEGIRWSTGSVLDQAIDAGRAAGLSVALLDPIPDVDDAADLAALDLTLGAGDPGRAGGRRAGRRGASGTPGSRGPNVGWRRQPVGLRRRGNERHRASGRG